MAGYEDAVFLYLYENMGAVAEIGIQTVTVDLSPSRVSEIVDGAANKFILDYFNSLSIRATEHGKGQQIFGRFPAKDFPFAINRLPENNHNSVNVMTAYDRSVITLKEALELQEDGQGRLATREGWERHIRTSMRSVLSPYLARCGWEVNE